MAGCYGSLRVSSAVQQVANRPQLGCHDAVLGSVDVSFDLDQLTQVEDPEPSALDELELDRRQVAVLADRMNRPEDVQSAEIGVEEQQTILRQRHRRSAQLAEAVKRPGNGINPMRWDEIVGAIASKDYDEDDLI